VLARITEANPAVNAIVTLAAEQAARDRRRHHGAPQLTHPAFS
jgi:Asp-tRNA(Asn)/Glu-tRNA(Gln) amidotransferase A subunit family amidase